MTITVETISPPESGILDLNLHLKADIQITPQQARKQVSVYVGNHIADLLHGEMPDLVVRSDGTFWRVPVVLSSRSLGRIGVVGVMDVDVKSGELSLKKESISNIEQNAQRFATGAAL